ncbi:sigma-70 family RNA polymerase sigma factor [candidate division KSB1 bacterium]|nr:sigma-70 family RNA polymerase sigma factor [candidate division KSB1 bacterium]
MARVKHGDISAMTILYERYNRPLLAFFRRMLGGDHATAEDMLQETFVRLIDRAGLYRSDRKFSTYLYCIAYNLCKNEYRHRGVRKKYHVNNEMLQSKANISANIADDPHEDVAHRLFTRAVFEELRKLNPEKKSLFLLRYQQELSIGEIAEITGVAAGTVKSRLFHISRRLAQALQHFHMDEK